jgi:hypothetical protein
MVALLDCWYKYGLLFSCRRCGQCCRGEPGYVWVTEAEISRMAAALQLDLVDFTRRFLRKIGDRQSLIELSNGDCVFYSNGCAVYAARPVQCRTFPFWPNYLSSPETWGQAAQRCPGVGSGTRHSPEQIDALLCEMHLLRSKTAQSK